MGGWKDTSTYSTVTAKREPQGNLIAEVRAYPHTGKITDHESVRRPASSHGGFISWWIHVKNSKDIHGMHARLPPYTVVEDTIRTLGCGAALAV